MRCFPLTRLIRFCFTFAIALVCPACGSISPRSPVQVTAVYRQFARQQPNYEIDVFFIPTEQRMASEKIAGEPRFSIGQMVDIPRSGAARPAPQARLTRELPDGTFARAAGDSLPSPYNRVADLGVVCTGRKECLVELKAKAEELGASAIIVYSEGRVIATKSGTAWLATHKPLSSGDNRSVGTLSLSDAYAMEATAIRYRSGP
jgi:hypothetical protein